jgi:hypothetical protein
MKKAFVFIASLALGLMGMSATAAADGPEPWSQKYESYFNHIGTTPDEAETNYAENVQGITHDNTHWFISQEQGLWKIPVGVHLAADIECGASGVVCGGIGDPQLGAYNHIGDVDYYQYNPTTGFLLLPLEDYPGKAVTSAIAVFNPVNLEYIAHAELPKPPEFPQPKNAPWVAVNPADGLVHTSFDGAAGWALQFSVNWDTLAPGNMSLQYVGKFDLLDESGARLDVIPQGGVFSESGDLLYINNGNMWSYDPHKDGISVFDTQTNRRIRHSTMASGEPFWYGYDTGVDELEEPEGLTIWDLDDHPGAPEGMSGQLHVLLLDNDWFLWDDDDVYVMHYTNKMYVDKDNTGDENGKPDKPFNTVAEALSMAWDGAQISIKAGTYQESLTFSKRIQVFATEGTATIGIGGRMSLSPSGVVNLSGSGMLRLY